MDWSTQKMMENCAKWSIFTDISHNSCRSQNVHICVHFLSSFRYRHFFMKLWWNPKTSMGNCGLWKKPIIIWWKSIRVLVQALWNFLKVPTLLMRRLLFSVDQCAVVVGSSPLMKKNHLDLFISDFETVLPSN